MTTDPNVKRAEYVNRERDALREHLVTAHALSRDGTERRTLAQLRAQHDDDHNGPKWNHDHDNG